MSGIPNSATYKVIKEVLGIWNGGGKATFADLELSIKKRLKQSLETVKKVQMINNNAQASEKEGQLARKTETIWLTIKTPGSQTLEILTVYHPPRNDPQSDSRLLEELETISIRPNVMIMGDFNAPNIDWNLTSAPGSEFNFDRRLLKSVQRSHLTQYVSSPTRLREGQLANCLDLVLTKAPESVDVVNCLPPLGKSDHVVLQWEYSLFSVPDQSMVIGRNIWRGDFGQMRLDMRRRDWKPALTGCVLKDWLELKAVLNELITRYCPMSKKKITSRPRWLKCSLKVEVNRKQRLWKAYLRDKTNDSMNKYKAQRNRVKCLVYKTRQDFEGNLLNYAGENPKLFFNYIRQSSRNRDPIPMIKRDDGVELYKDDEKAEHLSRFFQSVFTKDVAVPADHYNVDDVPTIDSDVLTKAIVQQELLKLKEAKSPGPDEIPAKLLKELATELAEPLCLLFQASLDEGRLPPEWKTAWISPIHKSGSRASANNYRPVSLTSICCKVMERIIKRELMRFLGQHHLLSNAQHGFRRGRSCLTNLLYCLEQWTRAIDEGNVVHVAYIDFKKAFDSVPHQLLLYKLSRIGVRGKLLKWIENFLIGRSQTVRLGGQQSAEVTVTSGVPQGSVLGPILFLIYIDDCIHGLDCDIAMFADDIKLWTVIRNEDDEAKLQANLDRLEQWSGYWLLPSNVSKCNILRIGRTSSAHRQTYYLNHTPLPVVEVQKDLGETTPSVHLLALNSHLWLRVAGLCSAATPGATASTGGPNQPIPLLRHLLLHLPPVAPLDVTRLAGQSEEQPTGTEDGASDTRIGALQGEHRRTQRDPILRTRPTGGGGCVLHLLLEWSPQGQETRRGCRLRHPERHRGTTTLSAAGHQRSPDEPPSTSPAGRQIRHHHQRLRPPMTSPDAARDKFYEDLHALLATVSKADTTPPHSDEHVILSTGARERHLEASSVASVAPAGLCPRPEARSARGAGAKAIAGADVWTDHRLVISKMRIRLQPHRRPQGKRTPRKLNTAFSSLPAHHLHFSNELAQRLDNLPIGAAAEAVDVAAENASVENRWRQLPYTVQSTALAVFGRARRQHQDWFDDNDAVISNLLAEKNRLHKAYVDHPTADNKAAFYRSRRHLQQRLREMQDAWTARKAEEIQGYADRNEWKNFFSAIKAVYGPPTKGTAPLLSADGSTLLTEKTQILQRWAEHFQGVLSRTSTISDAAIDRLPQVETNVDLDLPPPLQETIMAVQQLSSGKAPGSDAIPAEIYKHGGPQLMGHLTALFYEMWRQGEVPQHFKDATIVHLYKREENRQVCDNHRGISLLNIAGKIFARILPNRLNNHLEKGLLPESQCGFRRHRGTTDMIFAARQLQEKCQEMRTHL
ncbi:hypothetical protein SprV_0802556700 [Sparganum proliferum]